MAEPETRRRVLAESGKNVLLSRPVHTRLLELSEAMSARKGRFVTLSEAVEVLLDEHGKPER